MTNDGRSVLVTVIVPRLAAPSKLLVPPENRPGSSGARMGTGLRSMPLIKSRAILATMYSDF